MKSLEEIIKDEANKLYPEVLLMNRGVMSYDELDEHNYQMEDKREAYIAGRSQNLAREKSYREALDYWRERCEAAEAVIESITEPKVGLNHLVRMAKWKDLKLKQPA